MKSLKRLAVSAGAAALVLVPLLAMAQLPYQAPVPATPGPVSSPQGIIDLINKVLFWVATIFWIAAAFFVFYAGFLYLTAAGDPEKVKKAGAQLLYAVIAIAIGLMAYGLPVLVNAFLGSR